jgi:hypothetical protein
LITLDPDTPRNTIFVDTKAAEAQNTMFPSPENTQYWHGSDGETHLATILTNSITAAMAEFGISRTYLVATNCDSAGQVSVRTMQTYFINQTHNEMQIKMFNAKLENELLPSILGMYGFASIEGSFSIFYGSHLNISLNGEPMIPYASPTFCDSLYSPVICPGRQTFDEVTNDVDSLFSVVSESLGVGSRYTSNFYDPL